MIRKIQIKNFQKHENLQIDLHPGVNVIVGRSGAGKSAGAVRPLKLLVFNKPAGESFRKWGSEETSVLVELEDGTEVSRKRSNKDNTYAIDKDVFRAFGKNPPDSVSEKLNMKNLNFAFQHDPLFMLSSTPGELSKLLNDMAGLDDVDIALRNINKRLWSDNNKSKMYEKEKTELETNLENFSSLESLDESVEELEKLSRLLTRKRSDLKKLQSGLAKIQELDRQLLSLDKVSEANKDLNASEILLKSMKTKTKEVSTLSNLLNQFGNSESYLKLFKRLDAAKKKIGSVKLGDLEKRKESLESLKRYWKSLWVLKEDLKTSNKAVEKLRAKFQAKMPDVCPLCGK